MKNHFKAYYHNFLYKRALNRQRQIDELCWQGNGKNSMIIMFHHVSDSDLPNVSTSCKCTIHEFKEFLNYVEKRKKVVSLDTMIEGIGKGENNMIVITFDDVPVDFFTNAYPLLREKNMPFVLYLAICFIDKEGYLSSDHIKELANDPLCTIGVHTATHPMLKDNGVNLKEEIIESKAQLEQIIEKSIWHLAYPYGTPTAISSRVIEFVEESKSYISATVAIPGTINASSLKQRYALPRIHSKLFMRDYKNY